MVEDSIQELNNLIGELDLFQREHEQKIKRKQHEKQQQKQHKLVCNGHEVHSTTPVTTMTTPSIGGTSDIYDSFENSSMSSNDRNLLMTTTNSTTNYSGEMMFGSDTVDGLSDLTDCQATTMSLKLNLSTTEYPLVMQKNSSCSNYYNDVSGTQITSPSSPNASDGSRATVHCIELIPESYNVSDDYVKEHSEIVVLRRKDSQNDMNDGSECHERSSAHAVNACPADFDASGAEHISSFRCSSFSKTDSNGSNDSSSTLKRGQSIGSADLIALTAGNRFKMKENINGIPVMSQTDQRSVGHANNNDSTASQIIRQKPIITPRPASLSGLFV